MYELSYGFVEKRLIIKVNYLHICNASEQTLLSVAFVIKKQLLAIIQEELNILDKLCFSGVIAGVIYPEQAWYSQAKSFLPWIKNLNNNSKKIKLVIDKLWRTTCS